MHFHQGRPVAGLLALATDQAAPLCLAAFKAAVGHSEPASGLASLLAGRHALCAAQQPPVSHLRALNPHVEALLTPTIASQHNAPPRSVLTPRQIAPTAYGGCDSTTAGGMCIGTSAFAFQGTNAHVVVQHLQPGAVTAACSRGPYGTAAWLLRVHWVAPWTGALAQQVASSSAGNVTVQLMLRRPAVATFNDHCIQASHRPCGFIKTAC